MSPRYLLACPCGHQQPVAASQAGGKATCDGCGRSLDVPRLRELRELPVESEPTGAGGGWSFRLGVLSLGVILAAALAAGAGYVAWTAPAPPPEFDPQARQRRVEQGLETQPPVELWRLYTEYYAPMAKRGLQPAESPQVAYVKELVRISRLTRDTLLYAAAGVLALSLAAFAFLPK